MFVLVGTTVNSVSAPRASRTKQTRITRTTVMQSRRIRQTHSTKTLGHARYWHSGTLVDGFVNDVKSSLAEVGAVKQLVRRQPTRGSAGGAKPQRIGLDKVVSMNPPSGLALGKTAPGSSAETEAAEVFTVSLGLIGGAGFALLFTLLGTMYGLEFFGAQSVLDSSTEIIRGEQPLPMMKTVAFLYVALMAIMTPLCLLRK